VTCTHAEHGIGYEASPGVVLHALVESVTVHQSTDYTKVAKIKIKKIDGFVFM